MNERIKLLIEQATTYIDPIANDGVCWDFKVTTCWDFDKEKFAQLIVRECAELFVDQRYMILNPHEPFANERVRALKEHDKDTVKKIKRHFGVEL